MYCAALEELRITSQVPFADFAPQLLHVGHQLIAQSFLCRGKRRGRSAETFPRHPNHHQPSYHAEQGETEPDETEKNE